MLRRFYDALVSTRVYRPAWSAEDALELVRKEASTAFDPRCVDALVRVLGQNIARAQAGSAGHAPVSRRVTAFGRTEP